MPSKTAIELHRQASEVMADARRHRERMTEELQEHLDRDDVWTVLSGPEPSDGPEPPAGESPIVAQLSELRPGIRGVVSGLQELARELGPIEAPDFESLQRFVAAGMAHYTARMLAVDDLHQQERQQDWIVRERRDRAAQEAYQTLVEVRSLIGLALHPAAASSILGIEGRTPNVPFVLRDVLGAAIERMEKPETFFPDVKIAGLEQNWSILIERLREVYVPLDGALREIEDEKRDADGRLVDRDAALERYREAYSGLKDILTGLYVLGGQRELARRLRAAVSRRNRSVSNPEPPPEDLPLPDLPLPDSPVPDPSNEDEPFPTDSEPVEDEPAEDAPPSAA